MVRRLLPVILVAAFPLFAQPHIAVSPAVIEHGLVAMLDPSEPLAIGGDRRAVVIGWTEGTAVYAKRLGAATFTPLPRERNPRGGANRVSLAKLGNVVLAAYADTVEIEVPMRIERPLVAVRLTDQAALIDSYPLRLSDSAESTSVVAGNDVFHVFANRGREIVESRVTPGGTLLAPFPTTFGSGDAMTLTASGTWFGWLEHGVLGPLFPPSWSVTLFRRTSESSAQPSGGWAFTMTMNVQESVRPAVATNGTDWVIAWVEGSEIRATFPGALKPVTIAADRVDRRTPLRAAWDGTQFVIAWTAVRDDGSTDIRGATLTRTAAPRTFTIAASDGDELQPALLGLGGGRTAVVYQHHTSGGILLASRVIEVESRRRATR